MGFLLSNPEAYALDVTLLTQQGSKVLRSWTPDELKQMAAKNGSISAQKLILDESTQNLELSERANVDLITIYGSDHVARVPRFMIWRGDLKIERAKDGSLQCKGQAGRLLVPSSIFSVSKISKIELSRASLVYPGIQLSVRTNPAASRGEKLFTQSCLACHGLPGAVGLKIDVLTNKNIEAFNSIHKKAGGMVLDAKATRGLIAYRDALKNEHSELKSKP